MSQKISKFGIALFACILILPSVIWGVLTVLEYNGIHCRQKFEVELDEKRKLASFPTSLDFGTLTLELENYYNDRVPFRSLLISTNSKIEQKIEEPYTGTIRPALLTMIYGESTSGGEDMETDINNQFGTTEELACAGDHDGVVIEAVEPSIDSYGYELCECSLCGQRYLRNVKEKIVDSTQFPGVVFNDIVLEGRNNWLFYLGNDSLGYYKAENMPTSDELQLYLSTYVELDNICKEQGKELVIMICPNKEQIYSEYMPTYEVLHEKKRVEAIVDYVSANSDVNIIYPKKELEQAKIYWEVYLKQDTHWNNAGAYIGEQSLCAALGMPTTNLFSLNFDKTIGGGGDLVAMGALDGSNYQSSVEYSIEYKPDIEGATSYDGFGCLNVAETGNDKHLALIGDSFSVAMAPYLFKDFDSTYMVYRDALLFDNTVNQIKAADIIVLEAAERIELATVSDARQIIDMLSSEE